MGCITRGWTSKDFLSHTESDRETAKIQKRKKKSRKRVSWFDGYGEDEKQAVECTEPESALGDGQTPSDGSGEDAMDVDEVNLDRPMLEMDSDHSNSDVFIRGWDSDLTEEDEDKDDRVLDQEMTADQDTDPGPSFGLSRKRCSITSCRNFLPLYDARKCCPSCRETDRERRRKRLCNIRTGKYSEHGPDESKDQESLSLKLASSHNQLKSYTLDDPAGFVAAGARLCSISGCKHIVPNQVEYKYKLCFPCRCRSSRNHKIQQARRDRQIRAASGLTIDEDEEPIEKLFPLDFPPPPQNLLRAAMGRCSNIDCGMKLDPSKFSAFQAKTKQRSNSPHGSSESVSSSILASVSESPLDTQNYEINDTEMVCEQCTWRRMSPKERRTTKVELHTRVRVVLAAEETGGIISKTNNDGFGLSPLKSCIRPNAPVIRLPQRPIPPPKPRIPTPYPEYQCFSHLICALQNLFKSFLQAQGYYLAFNIARESPNTYCRTEGNVENTELDPSDSFLSNTITIADTLKPPQNSNPSTQTHLVSAPSRSTQNTMSKFSFNGEFSIIAPDFEVIEREAEISEFVTRIMHQVETVTSLEFIPSSRSCMIAYGGLITRFACRGMVPMQYPPGFSPSLEIPPSRDMMGELEVVVLPVESHRCFPGQRTVVRFRLVG
ncbi:hypothetical protein FB446DRAFT_505365 [Lentinula raphanica]|nr:hypothetical protein FB446DRAFT_505365 [Lentinula raphanica]